MRLPVKTGHQCAFKQQTLWLESCMRPHLTLKSVDRIGCSLPHYVNKSVFVLIAKDRLYD